MCPFLLKPSLRNAVDGRLKASVPAPAERGPMSKKTKETKGLGKPKTVIGAVKAGAKVPAKAAPKQAAAVLKISPASARRPTDKPAVKDAKGALPPAPEGAAANLPKRK